MSETCPTVRVKCDNEQGFYLINQSDFDPTVHEPFGVEKTAPATVAPGPDGSDEADPVPMTVARIKEALAAAGIDIPDGVTKKADLQALLDASQ